MQTPSSPWPGGVPAALTQLIRGRRVLVTGGAGAIGSALVAALLPENDVTVFDNLSSGFRENLPASPDLTFLHEDLVFDEPLERVFASRFDIVFHLAANFANQNSVDNPEKDLLVNGLGTLRLLELARKTGCPRLVFASSSCVYGDCRGLAIGEDAPLGSETPYAMTKRLGEEYGLFYHRHHGLGVVIVRYFNSYGPGERPGRYRNAIPNMFARALAGLPLRVFGTGEETRDFTFVLDTVQGTLRAALAPEAVGKTFNIGTGRETRVLDLARSINTLAGSTAGIEMVERRDWDHVARRCADISRARQLLGYEPVVELNDGLSLTCDWLKTVVPADRDAAGAAVAGARPAEPTLRAAGVATT